VTRHLSCAKNIRTVNVGSATVVLDLRSGRVDMLLEWAHEIWNKCAATGSIPETWPPDDAGTTREVRLVHRLEQRGWLRAVAHPQPWKVPKVTPTVPSWGTNEMPAAVAPRYAIGPVRTLLAGLAIVAVLVVRAGGRRGRSFARLVMLLRAANLITRSEAEFRTADHAVRSVRTAASILPFRIACLEESIATVLVLAWTRRGATWCHGVATDPIRLHAWVEVNGVPVAEPASTSQCTCLMRIHPQSAILCED
jgi:hypothetical protein